MKIKECLEIATECGLETIEEAVLNIDMHCMNMFSYSEVEKEMEELHLSYGYVLNNGFDERSRCKDVLRYLEKEEKEE